MRGNVTRFEIIGDNLQVLALKIASAILFMRSSGCFSYGERLEATKDSLTIIMFSFILAAHRLCSPGLVNRMPIPIQVLSSF